MDGLSIVCAGLGVIEEDDNGDRIGYTKDEYCLDNLKDLLRFLRRDDPQTREVVKQVCKWNIVAKDLIPIIEHCQDDRNLVLNAVKVLVFLTMPIEATSCDIPQQIEYLWGLKSSITCSDIVPVIISLLEGPLENLECEAFTEDDWKLVQLVLTLFCNILAIQDVSTLQKAGGSATQYISLRDRFLEMLFEENVIDLVLVLCQHAGGSGYLRQDNLLLLETFHYIFLGQEPELIVKACLNSSKVDGDAEASLSSLRSIMEEEEQKRKLIRLRNLGCYTQFSGTFTRFTLDGSKTLVKGNPCFASHETLLKSHKNCRGPSKRTVWDHGRPPSTKNNILELLYDFVNQFLSGGYNVLMQSIREDVEKEHHAIQNSDIVIFFHVARFITSFQYHKFRILKPSVEAGQSKASINHHTDSTLFKGSICGPLAASMNESMFLLVVLKWRYAFDGLKETNDYKFLSAAGSLMKIMVRMLDLVLKLSPEDSKESQTARILLYKLFYDQTDQGMTQFLLNLIRSFNTHKQTKSDLADLVETIHVVLRLMENLQARGTLRVSRKARRKRKKRTLNDREDNEDEIVDNVIQNGTGASGAEQSPHLSLSEKETCLNQNSDAKEEDIIISDEVDVPKTSKLKTSNPGSNVPEMEKRKTDDIHADFCYETDDSSGDEQLPVTDEVDFKVSTLVSALVNSTIIQNLCWLLNFYKSNSISTNHYIICMLKRICDDLELSPMIYQLSLLRSFYDILVDQKSNPCMEHENIVVFLTSLVRRMLRKMKSYPLLFVEILFWKTRKECHYINCESMLNDLGNLRKESRKWGTVSEDGEIGSSEGKGWVRRSIADALGDDEADFLISRGLEEKGEDPYEAKVQKVSERSNGSYEKERITSISDDAIGGKENSDNEGHLTDHDYGTSNKKRKLFVFNDELEGKLKDLYEKYKDNEHCSRLIVEALGSDGKVSAAQVSKKLKQLGFKVPPKKRFIHSAGPEQPGEESASGKRTIYPNSNDVEEGSSVLKPLHTRKRICAFNEDQELMIKALFEQFKDHKRCSYMIANALASDGTFSTAQVSRKLKQLGLRVPKQKRSDANLALRDEDFGNLSTEGANDSDNETLSSLRKRSKTKMNENDNEERLQKTSNQLSQADSEDELLCSVLEKTGKVLPKTEDGNVTASIKQSLNEYDSGYRDNQNVIERDRGEQPIVIEAADTGDVALNHAGEAETKAISIGIENQLVDTIGNAHHLQNQYLQELVDALADSGDEMVPVESQKTAASRRKLRMVVDYEDDE